MKNSRIIIGGGGTGGHVFPAIAIAGALREIRPESDDPVCWRRRQDRDGKGP